MPRIDTLQVCVLSMLARYMARPGECHASAICRELEKNGFDEVRMTSVARVLQDFEDRGWATTQPGRRGRLTMKLYSLTSDGKKAFVQLRSETLRTMALVERLLSEGVIGLEEKGGGAS